MPKVLVEVSGGIDSAVCAYLLKKQGYEVVCACMNLNENVQVKQAEEIAKFLNLEFKLIDLRIEFKENVIDYFAKSYMQALTPNPCIVCNKTMKFGIMYEVANKLNCKYLATGHYAIVKNEKLYKAKDDTKDQSYVLYFLTKEQLSKTLLPLGTMTKKQIRDIALDLNMPCAHTKESQDICFVKDGDYAKYIKNNYNYDFLPGEIVDEQNNILGKHNGLINYTIGQRKGLNIALGRPAYVKKLDSKNNRVVLGDPKCKTVKVKDFNWIEKPRPKARAKLRYRQIQQDCEVINNENNVQLNFSKAVSAPAPGQFAVLYDGDLVLGGGTIC